MEDNLLLVLTSQLRRRAVRSRAHNGSLPFGLGDHQTEGLTLLLKAIVLVPEIHRREDGHRPSAGGTGGGHHPAVRWVRAASGRHLLGVQVCSLRGPLVSEGRFGGAPHRPVVEPLAALAPVLFRCPRLAVF